MITLRNSQLKLELIPEQGAAVGSFKYRDIDIFRPAVQGGTKPEELAMFLMVPYCSYIKDGHFNYFGINRLVSNIDKNYADPIHGDGRHAKWQIDKQDETNAVLSYKHEKSTGFPFDYSAKVNYKLDDNKLEIILSITNESDLPMPCGMGVHPYFLHPDTAQISFVSSHVWYHKTDPIFDRPYPTPKQWDFSKPSSLKEDFDTAFGGWNGNAIVRYPEQGVTVTVQAEDIFHHIVLYHPKKADFFCLEPISNTPDAFNLAAYGVIGTGIQSIGGHQTLSKKITFTCEL